MAEGPNEPPSGGGGDDGMEARVSVLEAHVGHIRDGVRKLETDTNALREDMTSVKVQLATMAANIAHLPSKGFVVTAATGTVAALLALLTLLAKIGVFAPFPFSH